MKYHNTIESNTQYTCDIMYTSDIYTSDKTKSVIIHITPVLFQV